MMDTGGFAFNGVSLAVDAEHAHVRSERALLILSSAVLGGGLTAARHIINRHVDKNYHSDDVDSDQLSFARSRGVAEPFVGLLTAVRMDRLRWRVQMHGELSVAAIVTAGVANAASAGVSPAVVAGPGTINIIVLIDAHLTPAAMVNAVITATEAKTHVLLAHGVRTPAGEPATGTSTDAVVIACTGQGPALPYAGPLTTTGWLIGQCVRRSLEEALV